MSCQLCPECIGRKPCLNCEKRFSAFFIKSKFCPKCETEKLASSFNKRRNHRLSSWCKMCNKENSGKYREARKIRFAMRKQKMQMEMQAQRNAMAFI